MRLLGLNVQAHSTTEVTSASHYGIVSLMNPKPRTLFSIAALLVLLGAGVWLYQSGRFTDLTTPTPERYLPVGATNVDDLSFTFEGDVYFRGSLGTSAVQIPDGDADSFEPLSEIFTYPDPEISVKCGAPGRYAFYADRKYVYFYQVWQTPTFRSTKVEAVKDIRKGEFTLISPVSIEGASVGYDLSLEVASGTCAYKLTRRI